MRRSGIWVVGVTVTALWVTSSRKRANLEAAEWVVIDTWECDVRQGTNDIIETVRHAHG